MSQSKVSKILVFFLSFQVVFAQVSSGNPIDIEHIKVLRAIKVNEGEGAHFRESPDDESPIMGLIEQNEKLNVIEELEDWLGVAVAVQRTFMENGAFEAKINWEKVYVKKSAFASQLNLKLKKEDLNQISMFLKGENPKYFDEPQTIDSLLKIELIDKTEFEIQKKVKVDYFISDTTRFLKTNGELNIACKKKKMLFKDNNVLNESIRIYHYLGQLPELNAHIIGCMYWEDLEYKLIDMKTGEELSSTSEFPFLSKDKDKMISIYANMYDLTGDLSFYKVDGKHISPKYSLNFAQWMPSNALGDIFWGSDNCLYLAVINKNNYWKEDGNLNTDFQYVKIKFD